ncbi:hypothetical protein [Sodalis sp.]|uniref:hypothetical protein n=1 Tax=Sodalis sp. (in: enterobacteria) TaxID=1898979 RepID=UPI003872DEC8
MKLTKRRLSTVFSDISKPALVLLPSTFGRHAGKMAFVFEGLENFVKQVLHTFFVMTVADKTDKTEYCTCLMSLVGPQL